MLKFHCAESMLTKMTRRAKSFSLAVMVVVGGDKYVVAAAVM